MVEAKKGLPPERTGRAGRWEPGVPVPGYAALPASEGGSAEPFSPPRPPGGGFDPVVRLTRALCPIRRDGTLYGPGEEAPMIPVDGRAYAELRAVGAIAPTPWGELEMAAPPPSAGTAVAAIEPETADASEGRAGRTDAADGVRGGFDG